MTMKPVNFTSSGSIIRGYFFPTDLDSVIATVVFLQGFPGVEGDELICESLTQVGVHVLTFNYRGTFQSQGYFSFTNVIDDIGAALRFIKGSDELRTYQIDPEKVILGGWSFGGAMVYAEAVLNPEVRRIFSISGRDFGKEARKIASDGEYASQVAQNLESLRVPNGPLKFREDMIPNLIENQDCFDYQKQASQLKDRDILLIGGWDDDLSPIEEHTLPFYRSLVKNDPGKVRIEAVQDGHEFSNSKNEIVQIILGWLMME